MASVHPRYFPTPYEDSPQSGRLILRDGSTATIRLSRADDQEALGEFFAVLSDRSRQQRFFANTTASAAWIRSSCDSSNPRACLTLVVTRLSESANRIIATGSYVARDEAMAEIAVAVDDRFQGKGIGTLLLERLALLAVANGFHRLQAVTTVGNESMLEVFRTSGFELRTRQEGGYIEIDLSVLPSPTSVARAEWRDRVATSASLRPFFRPRSVAVVGASRNPANIGARILSALLSGGFKGDVYPVNPHVDAIGSLPAYASVRLLPNPPDLVVVAVPAAAVDSVIDDCAARGVRAAIVITAGFAEIGAEGRERQQKLLEKIRGHGMRMVGPNCLGLLNTDPAVSLNASFAPDFPPVGNIAFCSQSGALGLAMIRLARERALGLSNFISVGNKADISGNDLLQYWEEDQATRVIMLYLESFGNPRRFARIAQRVSRAKPIVVVKAGRTGAGKRAAGSHTAALAADDVATDALFHQTGVIRADTLDEMFDLAAALSSQPLPNGRRVAILTNAGGLGILCTDACEANGLLVQELSTQTKQRLQEFLPPTASVTNPVDMIASASAADFGRAIEILLSAAEVDALVVLTIHIGLADITAITSEVHDAVTRARSAGKADKPVLTCIMDGARAAEAAPTGAARLPNYAFPESAARVLGKLAHYAEWRAQPQGILLDFDDIRPQDARTLCHKATERDGAGWLSGEDTRAILSAFALPLPPGGFCRDGDEAALMARRIGFPVAIKLASRTIVHKSEVGGVCLNLADENAVRQAFAEIHQRLSDTHQLEAMDGVLVQPMIGRRRNHDRRDPGPIVWAVDRLRSRRHSRGDFARRLFSRHADHRPRRRGNGAQHQRLSAVGRLPRPPAGGRCGHRRDFIARGPAGRGSSADRRAGFESRHRAPARTRLRDRRRAHSRG